MCATKTSKVEVKDVINPYFAKVQFSNGLEDTVSTSSLAPSGKDIGTDNSTEVSTTPINFVKEISQEVDVATLSTPSKLNNDVSHDRPLRNRRPPERFINEY